MEGDARGDARCKWEYARVVAARKWSLEILVVYDPSQSGACYLSPPPARLRGLYWRGHGGHDHHQRGLRPHAHPISHSLLLGFSDMSSDRQLRMHGSVPFRVSLWECQQRPFVHILLRRGALPPSALSHPLPPSSLTRPRPPSALSHGGTMLKHLQLRI